MLEAVLNHPWLLHDHMEELTHLEFRNADAEQLKSAIIDFVAHDGAPDPAALRAELARQGFGETMERVGRAITTTECLGRADRGRAGRCFGDLAAAGRLASQVEFPN